MRRTTCFLFIAAAVSAATAAAQDLRKDDVSLIRYIETADRALKGTVGRCFEQELKRMNATGEMQFIYGALCEIKEREEGECHSYKVHASGVVLNRESALIKRLQLDLLCSNEGD